MAYVSEFKKGRHACIHQKEGLHLCLLHVVMDQTGQANTGKYATKSYVQTKYISKASPLCSFIEHIIYAKQIYFKAAEHNKYSP